MIRNEKGVTLVALIITIIVMIMLAGITIKASTNLNKETKLKNLQTSMLMIQAKAEEIYNKKEYGDIDVFPGEDVSTDSAAFKALKDTDDTNNDEETNHIKHLKKDGEYPAGLKVDSDDFSVNYKTGEVYSKTGFEGKHLLSELKNY